MNGPDGLGEPKCIVCDIYGCEKDACWMLSRDGKAYRFTFSKSLAEHIQRLEPSLTLSRVKFKVGRKLQHGEKSRSGLYAIMATQKEGLPLRITLFPEVATLLTPDRWREIREAWLV